MINSQTWRTRALSVLCAVMLAMSPVGGLALVGSGSAAPASMSTIPDSSISQDIPSGSNIPVSAQEFEGSVMSSDHADSLEVTLTTSERAGELINDDTAVAQGDEMALLLTDDQQSEGREVAIDSGLLQDALGYEPKAIYGYNDESGEQWSAQAQYQDGFLVFDVPHFSTNTVTFSGEVVIDATSVQSSTQFEYNIRDDASVSNASLKLTGDVNTQAETVAASNIADGEVSIVNLGVGGNVEPTGPSANNEPTVTFTGHSRTSTQTDSKNSVSNGGTIGLNVDGNTEPSGISNPEPTVTLTGKIDKDIVYVDNSNIKYTNSNGDVSNTGITAYEMGGIGDIDEDGNLEVAFADGSDNLKYVDANGDVGDTGVQVQYVGGMGDIDSDGELEIAYRTSGGDMKYTDRFGNTRNTGYTAYDAGTVADIDQDGDQDIIFEDPNGLRIVDGAGNTKTLSANAYDIGDVGDINGDGQLELGYLNSNRNVAYTDIDDNIVNLGVLAGYEFTSGGMRDVDNDGNIEIGFQDENDNLKYVDANGNVVDTGAQVAIVGSMADFDGDSTVDPAVDIDGDGSNEVSHSGALSGSQTFEIPSLDTTDNLATVSTSSGSVDVAVEYTERFQTVNPAVDINGDGIDDASFTGQLADSESVKYELPSLGLNDDTATVTTSDESVDVTFSFTERSETINPTVEIKSNQTQTASYTGTLPAGKTTELSNQLDSSLIGGNTVVTVTTSAPSDGPAATVDLSYSHAAQDQISTSYESSTFEEKYNISHTYAEATENAKVNIPFASSRVVGVKSLEYRINGGSWQSVNSADRRFEDTTATAYLSKANGGPLPAGSTVEVRASGRKVNVENGAVSIIDPTKPGEPLETQLEIIERSDGFSVDVGPTANGERVHYANSQDYPTQDYVIIQADGSQELHLPQSQQGDKFRISHLRTKVNAVSGDVKIGVDQAGSEPELEVAPGPAGSGDDVEITYYNTESGVTYLLNSLSDSIVIDSDTAQSPAVFKDDDDNEVWTIIRDAAPSSGSSSGGVVSGAGQFAQQQASGISGALGAISLPIPDSIPQPILLLVVGVGAFVVIRRLGIFGGSSSSGSSSSGGALLPSGIIGTGQRAISGASSGLLSGLRGLLSYIGDIVAIVLSNRRATIVGGIVAAIAAAQSGLFSLPDGTGILLVVAGVPIASWLILRSQGAVSQRVWLASTLGAVVIGLEFVASGTVQTAIEQLTSETVAPLLILAGAGALYLWYRQRQTDSNTPDTVNRLIFNGDDD